MSDRHIVVVDCESTGLRSEDIAVEIAWWNLTTGERGNFIPPHDESWVLRFGEERALEINGYRDRIEGKPQDDDMEVVRLHRVLEGNVLAGSNPTADAGWLAKLFEARGLDPVAPWHHRMWDLSAYAAGVLGLTELPGLWGTCQLLGIDPEDDVHAAEAGVATTGLCFLELGKRAGVDLAGGDA